MARPRSVGRDRVTTAIRFDRATHEALKETAEALTVGVNWLVNRFVEEGLARMDLSAFTLTKTAVEVPVIDWDTPTGDPMVVARKGFGLHEVGGAHNDCSGAPE